MLEVSDLYFSHGHRETDVLQGAFPTGPERRDHHGPRSERLRKDDPLQVHRRPLEAEER